MDVEVVPGLSPAARDGSRARTNVGNEMGGSGTDDSVLRAQVINMVERCPSGAMTFRLAPDADDIEPDLRPAIGVIDDGPLHVTGGVTVHRPTAAGSRPVPVLPCAGAARRPPSRPATEPTATSASATPPQPSSVD